MKKINVFIFMICFACVVIGQNKNQVINEQKEVLPPQVERLITDSLSGFQRAKLSQFDKVWRSYGYIRPDYCTSDFNGDKIKDYALVLLAKNHKSAMLCAFVSYQKGYRLYRIQSFDIEKGIVDIFISVHKKGYWESISGKLYVKNDGIEVEWTSESNEYGYYWKNGKFEAFYVD